MRSLHTLPHGSPIPICTPGFQRLSCIHKKLQQWETGAIVPVGFETLAPALLSMSEQEELVLQFPRKRALMRLHAKKLRHFDTGMLYGDQKPALLHSLKAFIGEN